MRLVLLGSPGAGKGTQAERTIERFDIPHLSTGDMLRAAVQAETGIGRKAKQIMAESKPVPDQLVVAAVIKTYLATRLETRVCSRRISANDRSGRVV